MTNFNQKGQIVWGSQQNAGRDIMNIFPTAPETPLKTEEMSKIKILFLAANPRNTSRLAIDEEMHMIEQKVRASEHRDSLVFQSAWAVRPDDLLQLLNQHQPSIVHFSGYGTSEGLRFVGDDRLDRLVSTRALKAVFTAIKGIRVVFLNACYSREQAQALVETVDCVIGMNESRHEMAAAIFSSSFYRAIGFGHSLQQAFDQGIASLLLEGIPEEENPKLLMKERINPHQVLLVERRPPFVTSPIQDRDVLKQTTPISDRHETDEEGTAHMVLMEVFISYAHKDRLLRDQLALQLSNLRRQNVIRDWFDGDIVPGTEWKRQIQLHLESAQIILLLISADFLASEFCYSIEMTRAIQWHKEGKTCVLPILLRPTDYEGAPFAELSMLPTNAKPVTKWANQDDAFQDIVKGIRKVINELQKKPSTS